MGVTWGATNRNSSNGRLATRANDPTGCGEPGVNTERPQWCPEVSQEGKNQYDVRATLPENREPPREPRVPSDCQPPDLPLIGSNLSAAMIL